MTKEIQLRCHRRHHRQMVPSYPIESDVLKYITRKRALCAGPAGVFVKRYIMTNLVK